MKKSGLAFHCHHDVLCEFVYDYDERVEFIKVTKPKNEQELRLRLFQLIPDNLIPSKDSPEWEAYNKAWEAYNKAGEVYDKAGEVYDKAWEAYDRAWEARNKIFHDGIELIHKKLCPDCTWNGKTILTRQDKDGKYY